MKRNILNLLFLSLAISLFAQDWHTDFAEAKDLASKGDKKIILVFQGSDWCAPCIRLEREVWSTEEFKRYAEENYVMLQADFPRKKQNALEAKQQEQNKMLAETYNQSGYFPYVVILDNNGKVLGTTGYKKMKPAAYIEHLESFKS